jgi:hypothetical protein
LPPTDGQPATGRDGADAPVRAAPEDGAEAGDRRAALPFLVVLLLALLSPLVYDLLRRLWAFAQ